MVQISTLDLSGLKNQSVGGMFFRQETPAQHLGIIFPGYGYTCDRALLHYPMQMLLDQGADVLQVNYAFTNKPGFWQGGDETRAIWFGADATVAMRAVLEQGAYKQFTLIGKSLGTLAVSQVMTIMKELADARVILFTPLLKNPRLVQQIIGFKGKTLLVVGTEDTLHASDTLKVIQTSREVEVIEVKDGNHALDIPGEVIHSLDRLMMVMQGVDRFLEQDSKAD